MADDRPGVGSGSRGAAEEERLRARLRIVAGAVVVVLIVVLTIVDVLGRLLVNPNFHVDPVMFGSLLGALLLLVGVEGAARLPWSGPK